MLLVATTKMSSKGQVVPEQVRNQPGLKAGDQFVVIGGEDAVILKTISPPSISDFDMLIRKARQQARHAGMRRSDVTSAVEKVRRRA